MDLGLEQTPQSVQEGTSGGGGGGGGGGGDTNPCAQAEVSTTPAKMETTKAGQYNTTSGLDPSGGDDGE